MGPDVNTSVRVYFGDTALHKAASRGVVLRRLSCCFKHGADVNAKNNKGWLDAAARCSVEKGFFYS